MVNILRPEWEFDEALWGIDDPRVVKSIWRACWVRQSSIVWLFGVFLAGCAGVGLITFVVTDVLGGPGWLGSITFVLSVAASVHIFDVQCRRRLMRALPEVLRSMGRCVRCGYQLDVDAASASCPECGLETEMTADGERCRNFPGDAKEVRGPDEAAR
jgi:Flp pilus assembly protein TadB